MENLPMNILDISVVVVLFLGAIIGLALGFVRSGLFILSWLGSAVVTIFTFPHLRPYARQYIEHDFFADLATGVAVFIATLIVLFLVSSVVGGWVRNSRLNALDRSLGMLAGIATAALLISGGYIITENIWPPEKQPNWIKDAKSLPLIRTGGRSLNEILPEDFKAMGAEATDNVSAKTRELIEKEAYEKLVRPTNRNSNVPDRNGYDKKERRGIENLLYKTQ
jgi:membrane protein required for colicin V production